MILNFKNSQLSITQIATALQILADLAKGCNSLAQFQKMVDAVSKIKIT